MPRITPVARRLRRDQTSAEELLWAQLRARRCEGEKFRRQVPIAGRVADFAALEIGLTIELDGIHHLEQPEADSLRTREIEALGYVELRFPNAEIVERLDWVMQEIRRAIDVARNRKMRAAHPRWGS